VELAALAEFRDFEPVNYVIAAGVTCEQERLAVAFR
jgi:hypothetical protein